VHQTYDYSTTRPRIKADDDRNLKVVGGLRRLAADDVPPSKIAEDKVRTPAP
jgi:hypothetical protein